MKKIAKLDIQKTVCSHAQRQGLIPVDVKSLKKAISRTIKASQLGMHLRYRIHCVDRESIAEGYTDPDFAAMCEADNCDHNFTELDEWEKWYCDKCGKKWVNLPPKHKNTKIGTITDCNLTFSVSSRTILDYADKHTLTQDIIVLESIPAKKVQKSASSGVKVVKGQLTETEKIPDVENADDKLESETELIEYNAESCNHNWIIVKNRKNKMGCTECGALKPIN